MLIVAALGASGLYGWQRWQQRQQLWQTVHQVRDCLLQLREGVNRRNHDRAIDVIWDGTLWCLVSSATSQTTCRSVSSLVFTPPWDDVEMAEITPSPVFFGLHNTAWAGHVHLKNTAGEWRVVVSDRGRIGLRERNKARLCQ